MDIKEKFVIIRRVKGMMEEKGINRLFLDETLHLIEPHRDNPFSVSEVCIDSDGKAVAWCHWDQRNTGYDLSSFQGFEVQRVENMVKKTLEKAQTYRVPIIAYVDVLASSEKNAIKTVGQIANLQGGLDKKSLIFKVADTASIVE